jgi:hypothetical protein
MVFSAMSRCRHPKQISDEYGVSCQLCKKPLKGYGFGGFLKGSLTGEEICLHEWDKSDPEMQECNYCFEIREQPKKAN